MSNSPRIHTLRIFNFHPTGLVILFLTQMWERFSYYGMRALLVLYLTSELLQPGHVEVVAGYPQLRAALEWIFGPLSIQAMASQIYGLYEALVYFTPLLGGLLADRLLGERRSVFIGGTLIATGHCLMVFESAFLLALALIVTGSGFFTPNVASQVGGLYGSADHRRDEAFSIYYVGVNFGAFAAPLVCGTVGELFGWHYGFALAGGGMLIGLITYYAGRRHLPSPQPITARATGGASAVRLWLTLGCLVLLSTLFWAGYEQVGNVLNLWLLHDTDRHLAGETQITVSAFQAINPLLIFLLTPLLLALWHWLARRRQEPSTLLKMALGCGFLAGGYLVLTFASILANGAPVSWLWTVAYLILLTLGELHLSPTSWSLFSRLAPPGSASLSMGIWYLSLFAGSYLAGYLGTFWEPLSHEHFWLVAASIPATGCLGLLLLRTTLAKRIQS